ncbi:hypothetical protein, partial [Klebsiella pneumoniae]|uniref:hypothetical protein n=1 Tax=Klebsiella pneumoniae TaxID=573 RepID=UPI00370FFCFF
MHQFIIRHCQCAEGEEYAMPHRSMKMDDTLDDFAPRDISLNDVTKRVYVAGHGPAVIVMTEMPGISPH